MELYSTVPQFINTLKITERYNILICLKGLPDFIILKFNNRYDAKKAFKKIKQARQDLTLVEVSDCYEDILIDGQEISYLSFSKVEEQKHEKI